MSRRAISTTLNAVLALGVVGLSRPALGQVIERHEAPGLQQAAGRSRRAAAAARRSGRHASRPPPHRGGIA